MILYSDRFNELLCINEKYVQADQLFEEYLQEVCEGFELLDDWVFVGYL